MVNESCRKVASFFFSFFFVWGDEQAHLPPRKTRVRVRPVLMNLVPSKAVEVE